MPRTRMTWRGRALAPLVAVLALVATGCDTGIDGIDGSHDGGSAPATKPVTLVVSEVWVNDHQGDPGGGGAAGGSDVQARLTTLQRAIDRLRDETGTGWVGRQDDVTGYLSELSGGSWPGTPTARSWTTSARTCSASTRACCGSASPTA